MNALTIRRIYAAAGADGERRVLVDRLWPRGIRKDAVDGWAKEIAPSQALHKWYKENPSDFAGFRSRYRGELETNPAAGPFVAQVSQWLQEGPLVLLYALRDEKENNAAVLLEYLQEKLKKETPR